MHIFRNLGFLFSKAIVGNRLLAKFGKSESNGKKNKKKNTSWPFTFVYTC